MYATHKGGAAGGETAEQEKNARPRCAHPAIAASRKERIKSARTSFAVRAFREVRRGVRKRLVVVDETVHAEEHSACRVVIVPLGL